MGQSEWLLQVKFEFQLTSFTTGGCVALGNGAGSWKQAFAIPLTRMSSTIMERDGIVNPNSRLYLHMWQYQKQCDSYTNTVCIIVINLASL